jgi:hypothetical protein
MKLTVLLAFVLVQGSAWAESDATNAPPAAPESKPPAAAAKSAAKKNVTAAQLQAALDQLTQSNRDLLDLLKQQQAVLQDIQYDRRLQSRQIQSLEERLGQSQMENARLQSKVDSLEAAAVVPSVSTSNAPPAQAGPPTAPASTTPVTNVPSAGDAAAAAEMGDHTTSEPESTLPPAPEAPEVAGAKGWHRLFVLKGEDGLKSDLFRIQGRTWRVLWHNADKAGKAYANTSALFVNAFPRDDTIPQQVCSKLGTGGDSTELLGPGNYYLKVEASGGSWELAVEDYY